MDIVHLGRALLSKLPQLSALEHLRLERSGLHGTKIAFATTYCLRSVHLDNVFALGSDRLEAITRKRCWLLAAQDRKEDCGIWSLHALAERLWEADEPTKTTLERNLLTLASRMTCQKVAIVLSGHDSGEEGRMVQTTAWATERALLLVLSVSSLLLVTVYLSASSTWLRKDVYLGRATPFADVVAMASERHLTTATGVRWELSFWEYCLTSHVGANSTTICTLWKEACRHADLHHSPVCDAMSSLQSLGFLSLTLSISGLYVGYRTIAYNPLWCLAIRALQLGFDAGMLLVTFPLLTPSSIFPYGLEVGESMYYCVANMCASLGIGGAAVFVFLRNQAAPRDEYVLFRTTDESDDNEDDDGDDRNALHGA
ncbi:hypothetical protein SDRG_07658 [Saprolegnia diclina VS20]|uniref:Uncharacterized protein n=1 Tax=Saprolegnia diclina (strain VS20) TaxID=1156394 RepID=T0QJF5_SAPDV|nr:hypothetical protein SDRG_07658 [Saprolegnia diclina VS20]EQC34856.1 hypothetical protein SDRG_07658 [Saprolegnia diclina VS20]|eukprot:XP_008611728.1 hypothetical protein SDRG_07658 [Saprolegnia diclina VS20]